MSNDTIFDLSAGAIWGAFIGDAAGAYLEFLGRPPNSIDVETALTMPGGGCWHTAPGQITDDGEMTIALARALADDGDFDIRKIAKSYRRWFESHPFDVGNATHAALRSGDLDAPDLHQICMSNADRHNLASKANGCLMRATPLGVWGTHHDIEDVVSAAKADCQLTHPNATCQIASASYVIAIRHLILNPADKFGAFDAAYDVAEAHGNDEVRLFLKNAKVGQLPECHPQAGYLGIAFTHAFYHLLSGSSYIETLRTVFAGGGDTDTNACIAGGLIGAMTGYRDLPVSMLNTVRNCNVELGRERPEWLQTRNFTGVIERML